MLRRFIVILAVLISSMATQVFALGLGAVTVESALNQPLRVRIEIIQLGDTRLQDISVQLASNDDFQRFNIERMGFLSNIRFRIESTSAGNFVVLSTNQIVREPYLSFILDTRWPSGRLLSEHTILLDLPVFDDTEPAAPVRQPISPVMQAPAVDSRDATVPDAPFAEPDTTSVSPPASTQPVLEPEVLDFEPADEPMPESAAAEAVEETPAESKPAEDGVRDDAEEAGLAVAEETVADPEPSVMTQADTNEDEAATEPAVMETQPEAEAIAEAVEVEPAAAEEISEEAAEVAAETVIEEEPETPAEPEEVAAAEGEPVQEEPAAETSITTGANDTLTDIALQVRPDSSVSIQQTMVALQELNPDAFIDGNINRMRSGEVLRVPSLIEIQAVDARQAIDEVSRQNQEFADLQPLTAPTQAEPEANQQPSGQLSVVTAEDGVDAGSGAGEALAEENAQLGQRIAELENQLALQQEEADRSRIAREELESRLGDLEEQIAAAEEIIRLQDLQLAQLQESLVQAAAEAAAEAELEAQQQVAPPAPTPASEGLLDTILRILAANSLALIGGAAAIVLLLVAVMLRRNRAKPTEADELEQLAEQEFDSTVADDVSAVAAEADQAESATEPAAGEDELDADLDDILSLDDIDSDLEPGEEEAESESEVATETPETEPEIEQKEDLVAQAEAFLAQDKLTEAGSLLRSGLEDEPNDHRLRLKLLEVLGRQEDQTAFEVNAEIIADEMSPIMDREVSNLRQQYFADSETVAASESAAAGAEESDSFLDDLGIDLDSFDDGDSFDLDSVAEPEAEPEPEPKTEPIKENEGGEEAEPAPAETSQDTEEEPAAADEDDLELDAEIDLAFDLGGDEEEAEAAVEDQVEAAADELEDFLDLESFDEEPDRVAAKDAASDTESEIGSDTEEEATKEASAEADDALELDLSDADEKAELASGGSKDAEDLEIEAFDFDIDDEDKPDTAQEASTATESGQEDELDLETFAFDTDDLDLGSGDEAEASSEPEAKPEEDGNAVEFSVDVDEVKSEGDDLDAKVEDLETFDFDLADTVIEKPESEAVPEKESVAEEEPKAAADKDETETGDEAKDEVALEEDSDDADSDVFDFDLDEFEISDDEIEEQEPAAEDDAFIELDDDQEEQAGQDDNDFDLGLDDDTESPEPEPEPETEEDDLEDLEFLSDDNDTEIGSVDDIEEIELLSDDDEVATKLELAYAYKQMGDAEGAQEILQEVIKEGNDEQVKQAKDLLQKIEQGED